MDLNKEFKLDKKLIYLNHAAVSPWPDRTAKAVSDFAAENVKLGASHYPEWIKKESYLREQLRTLINAQTIDSIALLKNTSEALSVVAEGIKWKHGENIVSSDQEFPSNRIPWQAQEKHGVDFREVSLEKVESAEQALMDACDRNTRMLTISSVQYGSGLRINLEQLGAFCRKRNILFCVDAIQSLGAHQFDVQQYQADFVMADAHKWMMGPEGIALFYCRDDLLEQLELHQFGWHMVENAGNYDLKEWNPAHNARRFECGSPNMLGVHALSASLSLLEEVGMESVESAIRERIDYLFESCENNSRLDIITHPEASKRAGIFNIRISDCDVVKLHKTLMNEGVICACRYGGIRFSPHFYTEQKLISKALDKLNLNI